MKIKNYWPEYQNYRTVRQWTKMGYDLKPGAVGVELWSTNWHTHKYRYCGPDEVSKVPDSGIGSK